MSRPSPPKHDLTIIGEPLWVHGLRPSLRYDEWIRTVAFILLEEFEKIHQGDNTVIAELGLNIPTSWYWYIGRTEKAFGHAIFFSSVAKNGWAEEEGGMCPFDTGGLWHNYIETNQRHDIHDVDFKKSLFDKHNKPLENWPDVFREYIRRNYINFSNYVKGEIPGEGVTDIIKGPPNNSKAWTWEGRIRKDLINRNNSFVHIFCLYEDREYFLTRILEEDYDYEDMVYLTDWMDKNCTVCTTGIACDIAIDQLINLGI